MKVKRFLDSIAYCLLIGNTNGIETQYKSVMHAKREIPVSSCTSEIDNLLYASGGLSDLTAQEERIAFETRLSPLDERAARYEQKKTKKRVRSKFAKKLKKGIRGGTWYRVDTDWKFWVGDNHYMIADQAVQYQPVPTEYGDYYAMDKILVADGKFYDMNYDEVEVYAIGGIVSWDKLETLLN